LKTLEDRLIPDGIARTAAELPDWPGTYILVFRLPRGSSAVIGALGRLDLDLGTGFYAGSARKGLSTRTKRWFGRPKKRFWHIDGLLEDGIVLEVLGFRRGRASECELIRRARSVLTGSIRIGGFGSSDCRCAGHLLYLPDEPEGNRGK
jgi:Uri superfamily endonuclease